ncbi:MAG: hypothetical protein A3G75_08850 [Verrucomicrobia bacterium RIFCSPLOWO2_12_FULL_64_8]|nr:MAG: hypothetical protein A3G75_08850 [Verrucomicrobia bacterium RIFCSPLOWO2_12_FULL_64_8]
MRIGSLGLYALLISPLAAAEKPAAPFKHERLNVANGCFVESVYFYDRFHERFGADAWVRLLQWGAKEEDEVVAGHAVAVLELKGKLWAWDINHGFLALDLPVAQREMVEKVSPLVIARYPRITARYPLYRHDFSQSAEPAPPHEQPMSENRALRDASRVAAKLAAHRPVNLVQFSYVNGGETTVSAAAVFLFHGRLCVYTADTGTVPFRARQLSVKNLRQLQECLRRIHPGAFALKSL